MRNKKNLSTVIVLALMFILPANASEKVDYKVIAKIREEGFNHSQVMEIASYMTDVYGPRFSNSRGYNRAVKWAKKKFEQMGISAKIEAYGEVGPGWENKYTSVHMHNPQYMNLIAYPKPYSKGTNGKVLSKVVYINVKELYTEKDLKKFHGKLRGWIVFTSPKRQLAPNFKPDAVCLSQEELDDMAKLHIIPRKERVNIPLDSYMMLKIETPSDKKQSISKAKIQEYFKKEGVAVLVEPGSSKGPAAMDKGKVHVSGGRPLAKEESKPLPTIIMAVEHYNRIMRIMEKGIEVKMEVETRINFDEDDIQDYNVIAEIPGTDLRDEIVMIGGHYDGESSGTGATDNAAGCAAIMEAMRILKNLGIRPRRTIRAIFWGGEESGHLGSKAYVKRYFYDLEKKKKLPGYDKLSVYFNMDWYGRFRGIFLQGNDLVRPIFEEWMKPFHDIGMSHLVPGNTGGTDHMEFVKVGLPGFQFIQDDLEFFTTTFHTNMDVYDRLVAEDLMQASVILASFAYNAAMREKKIPRSKTQIKNKRRWHK